MLNALNIDGLNCLSADGSGQAAAGWAWVDGKGDTLNINDRVNYAVLREGIDGFSNTTAEYSLNQNSNLMSEVLRQTNYKKREFGFKVAILGANHAEIERKRKTLLRHFSPNLGLGQLVKTFDTGKSVRITCQISSGYPAIPDGLPPNHQAKIQIAEIRFVAPDPYFYGDVVREYRDANGRLLVENEGDTVSPCRYRVMDDVCTNVTSGMSMSARDGKTIEGVSVDVTDRRVSALTAGGGNALGNFSHDSQFWMIEPGWNELQGVAFVEFKPKWSCI